MLCSVKYYTRPNGRSPIKEWREAQPLDVRQNVDAKVRKLAENGLKLLNTNMLDNISGDDKDLYELRNVTLKWRVAVFFNRPINTFILLYGWRKHQKVQERDIEQARRFLPEYLSGGEL